MGRPHPVHGVAPGAIPWHTEGVGSPVMRAMMVRENLQSVITLGAEVDACVRGALGEPRVAEIESAPRSKWLPLELDVELSRLVHEHAGREAFVEWSRASLLASAQSPMLSSFIRAGLRLLGGNPGSLIRLARRGYQQIFRHAGALVIEPLRDDAVRVVGVDLPEIFLQVPLYLEGIGESIAVLPQLVHHHGASVLEVEAGAVSWTISWRPAAG